MGAWIEMTMILSKEKGHPSLLSWERGLKYRDRRTHAQRCEVAPLVGAWIEIENDEVELAREIVAPLVGAWIEITSQNSHRTMRKSLLSWERGLKLKTEPDEEQEQGRSSRGSVD